MTTRPDRTLDRFGSDGFRVGPLGNGLQCVLVRLDANGRIGRHPAVRDQVLLPVTGDAHVSGRDLSVHVEIWPGQAAVWDAGESHETVTKNSPTAVVLEGDAIAETLIDLTP